MKKHLTQQDLSSETLTVTLPSHIIQDLQEMERNTHKTIDELVLKSLSMFIATHSDYLARAEK